MPENSSHFIIYTIHITIECMMYMIIMFITQEVELYLTRSFSQSRKSSLSEDSATKDILGKTLEKAHLGRKNLTGWIRLEMTHPGRIDLK